MKRLILAAWLAAAAAPAWAAGDASRGEALFAQCAACHRPAGEANAIGPNLKGVVGRKAASAEDFTYSPPLRRSGITWTDDKLDAFLADPQAVAPGTKMPFAGVASPADRADIIAYLKTQ